VQNKYEINIMIKTGRNDDCPCLSGKKFKKCCLIKMSNDNDKFIEGHKFESEIINCCLDWLNNEFPDHKIIEITKYLTPDNYRKFQITNYTNKTIMIAVRNSNNETIFADRSPKSTNVIIMYQGSYQCFDIKKFELAKSYVYKMIFDKLVSYV